tara:strand:- start:2827 stop:3069 length:243 start_codon:yes stop_codon:yes gene_type:complete
MKSHWFKQCKTKEEKTKVKQVILSNQESLTRLEHILESLLKDTPSTADYDSPSWAYKEADRIGYNRALNLVLDIINLDKD